MAVIPTPLIERVFAKVEKTSSCWLWRGATSNGYGIVQCGRGIGTAKVHRVVYEHHKGPIPKGLDVMHSCHVRNCVNPDHLETGTRFANMAQSKMAGRPLGPRTILRGSANANAKLTEQAVRDILRRKASGEFQNQIARDYGVSTTLISDVVRRRIWKHVSP